MSSQSNEPVLRYTKVSSLAFDPVKSSYWAAGFELRSAYECIVPARGQKAIYTDLKFDLPIGCYGRIAPLSQLALKHSIDVSAGVIDNDYKGSIVILLYNRSYKEYNIKRGDRVAQLICEKIFYPKLKFVNESELGKAERKENCFGFSTDV